MGAMNNQNALQSLVIDLGSITADGVVYGPSMPQKCKVVKATLMNGAGIVQSDTNYGIVKLKSAGVDIATHSTQVTGGNSALTANVPAQMVLVPALVSNGGVNVEKGAQLSVDYNEEGTYALTGAKVQVDFYPL